MGMKILLVCSAVDKFCSFAVMQSCSRAVLLHGLLPMVIQICPFGALTPPSLTSHLSPLLLIRKS